MNDLIKPPTLPVFGPEKADCAACELHGQCLAGKFVRADPPIEPFNGIMFIGEGPGAKEVSEQRAFVGPSGRLLNALLEAAGIRREQCYVSNSTLCLPPRLDRDDRTPFHERFPGAIYACLPRLEAEIATVRPRVIVTLGAAALISVAGYEVVRTRQVAQSCGKCDPADRKIGPVVKCAVGECSWWYPVRDEQHLAVLRAEGALPATCPLCGANLKKLKPRKIKCPDCGGTKTRKETFTTFDHDHSLGEIAGGLLDAKKLPARLDQLGVAWIIPTYHPAFCLRPVDTANGKKFGGQYAARAVVDHLLKAKLLAEGHTPRFPATCAVTVDPDVVREFTARVGPYVVDIETNSEDGAFDVTEIKCVGVRHVGEAEGLVVDTRAILRGGFGADAAPHPLFGALAEFIADPAKGKILQNGHYDRTVLWWLWGLQLRGQIADTLLAHQNLYPDEPHNLGHIGACLTWTEAWKPPKKRSGALHFESFEELAIYNARDLAVTDLASERMGADSRGRGRLDDERVRAPYDVDMRLLDYAVEMTQTGLPVDIDALAAVGREAIEAVEKTRVEMQNIIERQCGMAKAVAFDPGNDSHVRWALFDPMGPLRLRVLDRTGKTKEASVAKETLLKHVESAFVQTLLEHKKHAKILSTYVPQMATETQHEEHAYGSKVWLVHADKRIRPIWNVGRAVTGRWTSSPNCFSADTEILTPRGWVLFPELADDDKVAQWAKADGITWTRPTALIRKPFDGELLHLKTEQQIDLLVTEDHRCLVWRRDGGAFEVVAAKDYPNDRMQLQAAHSPEGTFTLRESEIALLCATQADGSYSGATKIVFRFSKKRKIERLRWALRSLGAVWIERAIDRGVERKRRTEFVLEGHYAQWCRAMMPEKTFEPWVLDLSNVSRRCFCDEVFLWDGCAARGSMYSSSIRKNVDLVQAALTLDGTRRAKVRAYWNGNPNSVTNWQLDVARRGRNYSMTTNHTKTRVPYKGDVYCVSVPSSFIVVRRNGRVAITGQCQNWPKFMRACVVAPPGFVMVGADYEQLEARVMAALSGDPELIRRCATADGKRKLEPECDPHSFVASLVFGQVFTSLKLGDPAHAKTKPGDPKCKCDTCKRAQLREIVKRVVYGLNYGAGAKTVVDAIYNGGYEGPPITINLVERATVTYFKAFPGVPKWRDGQLARARQDQEVRDVILGRRRIFPLGDIEAPVAFNHPIQSAAASVINLRVLDLMPLVPAVDPDARLIAQVHDAIYFLAREARADALCALITETLSCELALVPGAPPMPFVAAAKKGRSWKDVS